MPDTHNKTYLAYLTPLVSKKAKKAKRARVQVAGNVTFLVSPLPLKKRSQKFTIASLQSVGQAARASESHIQCAYGGIRGFRGLSGENGGEPAARRPGCGHGVSDE